MYLFALYSVREILVLVLELGYKVSLTVVCERLKFLDLQNELTKTLRREQKAKDKAFS